MVDAGFRSDMLKLRGISSGRDYLETDTYP